MKEQARKERNSNIDEKKKRGTEKISNPT